MSFFQVTDEDIDALRLRLKDALGEEYEVETDKEVSALMGLVKETFDLAIFYHDDVICGIDYKYKSGGSIFYDRFQDSLIARFKKVGLKYGFAYTGSGHIYFWTKGSYGLESFSFDNMVAAIKGNQSCGMRLTPSDIMAEFMGFIPDELNDELNLEQIKGFQSLFTEENLVYDEEKASMCLKTEAEDAFFKILLHCKDDDDTYEKVCR